jgi:hypothetical protein
MTENKNILDKINHKDNLTVPEGFFDDFAKRMADSLPARPELEEPHIAEPPRSLWHRVRPYAYMVAMFAGVWCMLKMFTLMSNQEANTLETNPVLAEAASNEQFVDEYFIDDVNQWELFENMMDDGVDADSIDAALAADQEIDLSQVESSTTLPGQ